MITWVDGSDPEWKEQKKKYCADIYSDDHVERYRDWGLLRYWFRGVEKYAPWVRKIHFITDGQIPSWLDVSNPRLHVVKHEDYLPKDILPTFNSCVIENQMHKLEGLAEHFVYFNDDMFLIHYVKKEYFFQNGLPCDMLALQPVVANPKNPVMSQTFLNNTLILSKHFTKRKEMLSHPGRFFHVGYPVKYFCYNILELCFPQMTGFYTIHGASPFLKETFEAVWKLEEDILRETSKGRFRNRADINQYLFREWQKLSGKFVPRNVLKDLGYFEIGTENEKLCNCIRKHKKKMVCINDVGAGGDEAAVRKKLIASFDEILPRKSSFEL